MAEYVTYPLNTDAYYDAADAQVYTATRKKGVYANDHFNATVTGVDNSVTIAPGLAWAKPDEWSGVAFASKTPVKVDLPLADPSQPRFDLITIQFNSIREFRGEIDYIQGTPSSNPNYPETSQNNNVFELALYAVRRNVGAVTITAADIFDLRTDEQYCGIMRDGVTGIDTSVIVANVDETLAQLTAQGNATIEALDEALQSVLDRNGLMIKSEYANQPNVVNESLVSQDAQEHINKTQGAHTPEAVGAVPADGGTFLGKVAVSTDEDPALQVLGQYGIKTSVDGEFYFARNHNLVGRGISYSVARGEIMYLKTNGYVNVMSPGTGLNVYMPIRASAFTQSSSRRYKESIESLTLEKAKKILNLRAVEYDLKAEDIDGNPLKGRHAYGFIAEEVEGIDDTYVHYNHEGEPESLDYMEMIAPMKMLIYDLYSQIDELKKKLEAQHDTI